MARVLGHFQLLNYMPTPQFKVIPLARTGYFRWVARRYFGRCGVAVLRLLFLHAFTFPSAGHAQL